MLLIYVVGITLLVLFIRVFLNSNKSEAVNEELLNDKLVQFVNNTEALLKKRVKAIKRKHPFVPPEEGVYLKYYNHSGELNKADMTNLLIHTEDLGKDIDPCDLKSSKITPSPFVGEPGYLLRESLSIKETINYVKSEFRSRNKHYSLGSGNDITIWVRPSFTILDQGKKYNEEDLEIIYETLAENHIPKPLPDENFNVFDDLSDSKLKEVSDYKIKIRASRWKSTQRSLRKKGKLDQFKIDTLNKLGMVWNPKEDVWEKQFLSFKKRGYCYGLKKWINKQRSLFEENKLNKENLYRLQSIDFQFTPKENELFPISWKCYGELYNKLERKRNKLKREYNKLNSKSKIKKKKRTQDPRDIYEFRKYSLLDKINSNFKNLPNDELLLLIEKIVSGKSIYYDSFKKFYEDAIHKIFNGPKKENPMDIPLAQGNIARADLEDLQLNIKGRSQYYELLAFNTREIDPQIRKVACENMLNYFKDISTDQTKNFKPLDFLISYYKKQKNTEELLKLKEYINQYPLLIELYNDKIETILLKFKYL